VAGCRRSEVSMSTFVTVEQVPIDLLRPDPVNPRRIRDEELDSLDRSLRQFGFVQPVLARREDRTVIGGFPRRGLATPDRSGVGVGTGRRDPLADRPVVGLESCPVHGSGTRRQRARTRPHSSEHPQVGGFVATRSVGRAFCSKAAGVMRPTRCHLSVVSIALVEADRAAACLAPEGEPDFGWHRPKCSATKGSVGLSRRVNRWASQPWSGRRKFSPTR
jgi:hypothetical protein